MQTKIVDTDTRAWYAIPMHDHAPARMPGSPDLVARLYPPPSPEQMQRARLAFRLDVIGLESPVADWPGAL
jgi:hypothetical protein